MVTQDGKLRCHKLVWSVCVVCEEGQENLRNQAGQRTGTGVVLDRQFNVWIVSQPAVFRGQSASILTSFLRTKLEFRNGISEGM